MRNIAACVLAIALTACPDQRIDVRRDVAADVQRATLTAAVDAFVAAGRTPAAFAGLAQSIAALPGLSKDAAAQAELDVVILSLASVQSVQARPMTDQIDQLALAVWPSLLAPPIATGEPTRDFAPEPGDDRSGYVIRLCAGPLAAACGRAVPELQGQIVYAIAMRRAAARARDAVGRCLPCASEPGWHEAVLAWEQLDRGASEWVDEVTRRAAPENWPIAGGAARDDDAELPEAEVSARGDALVGGRAAGRDRVAVFRDLRGSGDAIALDLAPDTTIAKLRGVQHDARDAGCSRVAIVARGPRYPWPRKVYWLATSEEPGGASLQQWLRALDRDAGPAALARE